MAARAADPDAAARGLERYWSAASPEIRHRLQHETRLGAALVMVASASQFLTEALIQSPELLLWADAVRRQGGRAREDWSAGLAAFSAGWSPEERAAGLTRYKRREYLRIVMRDLLGEASLAETTAELSSLADAILAQAHAWAWNDLAERFGTPRDEAGAGAEMAVLGLGKLGGEELNYSSDIDLMFVYSADGETAGGGQVTSNREFFGRLAQRLIRYVSVATAEGLAYRVDLRLRPGGREGEVALALPAALRYYREQAREWELQMLIRARPCAGARGVAQALLDAVQPLIYRPGASAATILEGVRLSRERIQQQLEHHRVTGRRSVEVDVKLDVGGIRDIEFLVQYLQRRFGGDEPWVRGGNTLVAMQRLHDKRCLRGSEMQRLASAYALLRQVEHRLQLRLGQQTHALPAQPERVAVLARSLGVESGEPQPAQRLRTDLQRCMAEVRRLSRAYLGDVGEAVPSTPVPEPGLAAAAAPSGLEDEHGRRQWQRLLQSAATQPDTEAALRGLLLAAARRCPEPSGHPLPAIEARPPSGQPAHLPRLARALLSSDWMAATLFRRPNLALALDDRLAALPWHGAAPEFGEGLAALRDWRQRASLRALLEEWEERRPISLSLAGHTAIAEAIIAAALQLAQTAAAAPAPSFAILGLGRLGLGELDLLSDLDLVFVTRETERETGGRVTARLIEALTAYTQQGSLYAVDTRLRPGGREGELVQTPASLAQYFAGEAGDWEALSYLKARWIAGSRDTAGQALAGVAAALHKRFAGPRVTAAALRGLRDRIESEGRPGKWGLKTGAGGYYDADFIIGRRMLQAGRTGAPHAGLAQLARSLAPEMLPAPVAQGVAETVEFLRACDHALRTATGRAGSALPGAGEAVARAHAWLERIWPEPLPESLPDLVDAAKRRLRQFYHDWL